jgi:lactate dehydrogenase-like 2-hydroxyacid dehydrogenase
MSNTVLVTDNVFAKAEDVFRGDDRLNVRPVAGDESSLARAVLDSGSRLVIVGVQPYSGALYEALGQTGGVHGALIARFGVGHDSVDKSLARQHNIVVTITPGVLDASVAEHAMWLMGSLARHVAACHAAMTAGAFEPRMGIELCGCTLGILGFGAIGRRVARIAHFGFLMRVVVADQIPVDQLQQRMGKGISEIQSTFGVDLYSNDADLIIREADVLSIHLPATPETANFVNARRLALMKRDALLINTARGAVLDEDALYDALAAGELGGAALDVYQHEPYRPLSPQRDLRDLPNVVLTPHIGSNTQQANRAMARAALDNAANFLGGHLEQLSRVD